DKHIVLKNNDIIFPLLEEMNYDPKELESFFYNVDPRFMDYLLGYFNNDIKVIIDIKIIKL
ncbi:MAG: hypothetical protein II309_03505, partial [Bacilli bacterium]|nr:hypothetical protein [Bacilli bacterium]